MIAYQASTLVKTLLSLHKSLGIPLSSSLIKPVRQTVELLKAIEVSLCNRRRAAVVTVVPAALRSLASQIIRRFSSLRSAVEESEKSGEGGRKMRRVGACLEALESALKGTSSYGPARRCVEGGSTSVRGFVFLILSFLFFLFNHLLFVCLFV